MSIRRPKQNLESSIREFEEAVAGVSQLQVLLFRPQSLQTAEIHEGAVVLSDDPQPFLILNRHVSGHRSLTSPGSSVRERADGCQWTR